MRSTGQRLALYLYDTLSTGSKVAAFGLDL